MSAGGDVAAAAALVRRDLSELAPGFRAVVEAALTDCTDAGHDAYVFEALRTDELQALYWRRGRPPTPEYPRPVTYARSAHFGWHGYGLAVDVISRSRGWFHPLPVDHPAPENLALEVARARAEGERFFRAVAAIFKAHGCDWGGDWRPPKQDWPHFQWGTLRASPSDRARELIAQGGMSAVWVAVSAA